jgi:hypothetical protein
MLQVKLVPEQVKYLPGDGSSMTVPKQKAVNVGDFALQISGDLPTADVQRIDPIVVKTPNTNNVDFPNLIVTLPSSSADKWYEWLKKTSTQGSGGANTRSGLIELHDAEGNVIAEVTLNNIGIRRISQTAPASAPKAGIDSVTVELFVDKIELDLP